MHCGSSTPCRCPGGSDAATRCRARQMAGGLALMPSAELPALVARTARPPLTLPLRPESSRPHILPSARGGSAARLWPGRVASPTSLSRRAWSISSHACVRRQHTPRAPAWPWPSGSRGTTRSPAARRASAPAAGIDGALPRRLLPRLVLLLPAERLGLQSWRAARICHARRRRRQDGRRSAQRTPGRRRSMSRGM